MPKVIFFLFSFSLYAIEVSFIGPCSSKPIDSYSLDIAENRSVGDITVEVLKKNSIPFRGNNRGMNSIFDTPVGSEALVIISDEEMYAYGWCYSVNGVEPNKFSDEVFVKRDDNILWWFGFARYLKGKWVSQCVPAYTRELIEYCR